LFFERVQSGVVVYLPPFAFLKGVGGVGGLQTGRLRFFECVGRRLFVCGGYDGRGALVVGADGAGGEEEDWEEEREEAEAFTRV